MSSVHFGSLDFTPAGKFQNSLGQFVAAAEAGAIAAQKEMNATAARVSREWAPPYVRVRASGDGWTATGQWAEGAEFGIPDHEIGGGVKGEPAHHEDPDKLYLVNRRKPGRQRSFFHAVSPVHHPGVKGKFYMRRGAEHLAAVASSIMHRHMPGV